MITGQIEPCIRRKRKVYLIIKKRFFFVLLLFRFFQIFLSHGSLACTVSYSLPRSRFQYRHATLPARETKEKRVRPGQTKRKSSILCSKQVRTLITTGTQMFQEANSYLYKDVQALKRWPLATKKKSNTHMHKDNQTRRHFDHQCPGFLLRQIFEDWYC